ncbi:DEAD/DEAH box helicase [uncultured Thermus sp.]|uniref:DEAD/DEAH box helicase n=1 Tax=uncultured Thermus sp. TaxID=157149 RepID=UPI0026090DF1|nr:DEAD/DEAH box helicase [uncultured Thermus sp.]
MLPEALRGWESYRDWLEADPEFQGRIVFARTLPPSPPKTVPYRGAFAGVLEALGLKPFAHQKEALLRVEEGNNVVMAYSTAAGKSLVFQAPVLKAALEGGTSLLLFPTKALAHDQLRRLRAMAEALGVQGVYPYDGDTRADLRRKARQEGMVLLSNPDMLHFGLLPRHGEWAPFLSRLRYLVLDELHAYRGVFGTHVALVLFRLLRLARHYGANPQVIAASATIGNAKEHAEGLTGLPFVELREEVARSERELLVLLPKPLDAKGERRRSPLLEAAYLARALAEGGLRGIIFTNARKSAELIARYAAHPKVRPYRAGYTAKERRRLEEGLKSGEVRVLVSTSALELGVDIGELDAVALVGYPGSISAFWQRAGRAGRGRRRALVVYIPREDPLDEYFLHRPELLLRTPPEVAVADPQNPVLCPLHLHAAAWEKPLVREEILCPEALAQLREKDGRYYTPRRRPHRDISLRGLGTTFTLRGPDGEVLGYLDERQAYWEAHPGAVYLHGGESYLVRNIDPQRREIWLLPALEDYYTEPRAETHLEVLSGEALAHGVWVGQVVLRERVVAYAKKRFFTGSVLEEVPLDLPEITFPTEALWFHPPLVVPSHRIPGGIHALEHTLIGLLPLFVLAERQDLGGLSYPFYPKPLPSGGGPTIFIYDGYPGGVGYARQAARRFPQWIQAALELLKACPCQEGCPRCVLSPKCGNGNQYLDKEAALFLAAHLTLSLPQRTLH